MTNETTALSLLIFSCDWFYEKDGRLWSSAIVSSSIRLFGDNFSNIGIVAHLCSDLPDPSKHVILPPKYHLHPVPWAQGLAQRIPQAWKVLKLARMLSRCYDVLYIRMFSYPALPAALYCSLFYKGRWFLSLHGDIEESVFAGYASMNRICRFMAAKTMGLIAKLICKRPKPLFTSGPALGLKYAPQRNDCIPFMDSGIREEDIFVKREDTCASPPYELIYVGDTSRRKGIDILLHAVAKLKEMNVPVRLSIIGAKFQEDLSSLAKDLGITDLVNFAGWFSYGKPLFERIRQGDILVVPSRGSEGWNRAITEANAQGLPIVASDVNSLGIAVREGPCGIVVPPNDPIALAVAIKHIIESPSQRKDMIVQSLIRGRYYIYEKEFLRIRKELKRVFGSRLVMLESIPVKQAGY